MTQTPIKKARKHKKYKKNYFHYAVFHAARPFFRLYFWLKFRFHVENTPTRKQLKAPFIMVSNHISTLDSMFVIASMPRHTYFVGTEDLFCNGLRSRLLRKFVNPIPLFKPDMSTVPVREMLRRLRGGDGIMMFPEGHHSPDGLTTDIKDSVGSLVKAAKCSLVTYKLMGGFYMSPRWCATLRRGPVRGRFVNVYSPEQLAELSADEITALICADIAEDAVARQAEERHVYHSNRRAETLEVHYYICPECGALSSLHSSGNDFWCERCGLQATVDKYGDIIRTDNTGKPFPHPTWREWNAWQRRREKELLDTVPAGETIFRDSDVELLEYLPEQSKTVRITSGDVTATAEGFTMPSAGLDIKWRDLPWINYNRCARALQFVHDGHHYEIYNYTLCAYRYGTLFFRAKGIDIRY